MTFAPMSDRLIAATKMSSFSRLSSAALFGATVMAAPRYAMRGAAAPRELTVAVGMCDGAPTDTWTYRFPPNSVEKGHRCFDKVVIWCVHVSRPIRGLYYPNENFNLI